MGPRQVLGTDRSLTSSVVPGPLLHSIESMDAACWTHMCGIHYPTGGSHPRIALRPFTSTVNLSVRVRWRRGMQFASSSIMMST